MSDQNQAQISSPPGCAACHGTTTLRKCGRCHVIQYCSLTCQKADWSCHKAHCCRLAGLPWYDLYRQCKDGAKHEGRLEIITWSTPANEHEDFPEAMGWGNVIASEADQLKRKFETDLHGDEAKLYQEWPQAFRWTCCGASGENRFGCDHHGKGSKPCTCDFCRMGKRVPDAIHNQHALSAQGKGLKLTRGPDPRSIYRNRVDTVVAEIMRPLLGLPGSEESA